MRGLIGESSWRFQSIKRDDLEERVSHWLSQHEPPPSRWAALLLAGTFLAMVAFAALR
jgi:hypothetical protein